MPTGYLAGGQVAPRRAVKLNSAGKIVHAAPADMSITTGVAPVAGALGISQANGRGAPGTPWALGWSGTQTSVTPTGFPLAADADQEIQVWDQDGQECEAELATPTAADIDAGAGVITGGGAIVYGDKLTAGPDGVLYKLGGPGYFIAEARTDVALDNTTDAGTNPFTGAAFTVAKLATTIGMVVVRRGHRAV